MQKSNEVLNVDFLEMDTDLDFYGDSEESQAFDERQIAGHL